MRNAFRPSLIGIVFVAALVAAGSCKKEEAPAPYVPPGDGMCTDGSATIDLADEEPPTATCPGSGTELTCVGNWAVLCDDGAVVDSTNCRRRDEACVARECDRDDCERCLPCKPHSVRCGDDGARERCENDGSGYADDEACDVAAGEQCDVVSGECVDLCAQAVEEHSYIGCEYWAAFTSNSLLDYLGTKSDGTCEPFSFAIVVANAQGIDAHVSVETPDGDFWDATVPPKKAVTIKLPCSEELGGLTPLDEIDVTDPRAGYGRDDRTSVIAAAAHHITSDVPVTVYQFNPLEYESELEFLGEVDDIYSYTNDASLLLPVASLSQDYLVMAAPTMKQEITDKLLDETFDSTSPGFVAIVATSDEPTQVEITSSAHTLASDDDSLPALEPGDTHSFTLERGQVAQILSAAPEDCDADDETDSARGFQFKYCNVGKRYDLTGTRVHADHPVMVIGGHDCTFLPFNRWACDHIEEVMLPLETWGKDTIVSVSEAIACQPRAPNRVRVLADADDTRVSFGPASAHDPVTLNAGEFVDFDTTEDVRVISSKEVLVGQYLLGQDYEGFGTSGSFAKGDPDMSFAIPIAQWRDRYSILSPETFTNNYVNIIAHEDQVVLVDGRLVTGWKEVASTELATARVPVSGGQHTLESPATFGITVYGYATYTSYMLPGGFDLIPINGPD